jgi:hypothetical protein
MNYDCQPAGMRRQYATFDYTLSCIRHMEPDENTISLALTYI